MRRSRLLASLLVLALGVTGVAAHAQRVISMATLAPAGSTWMRVLEASSRELRRRTNGALNIRWYAGGVQGDDAEVIRKIRSGRLDGAAVTGAGLSQIHRPTLAFELPAIFESPEQFARARDALRPTLEAAFDQAGFVLLGFDGAGRTRMFSTAPIRTPAEMRRMHPWLWPDNALMPLIYQEVGVQGVPLQLPEVLSGLQTHRIDVVYGSPLVAIALQWASHITTMTAEGASAMTGGLVISRAQFNTLPADQQQIVREVVNQYHVLLARNRVRDEQTAEATLVSRGVQVVNLTPAERQQWLTVFQGVRNRAAGVIADPAWIARVQAAGRGS